MGERDRKRRDKFVGVLYFVLYCALCIMIAVLVHRCHPDDVHDEDYDEYLEEYYDGAERYDPF